jgi:hypothetical protein
VPGPGPFHQGHMLDDPAQAQLAGAGASASLVLVETLDRLTQECPMLGQRLQEVGSFDAGDFLSYRHCDHPKWPSSDHFGEIDQPSERPRAIWRVISHRDSCQPARGTGRHSAKRLGIRALPCRTRGSVSVRWPRKRPNGAQTGTHVA